MSDLNVLVWYRFVSTILPALIEYKISKIGPLVGVIWVTLFSDFFFRAIDCIEWIKTQELTRS